MTGFDGGGKRVYPGKASLFQGLMASGVRRVLLIYVGGIFLRE
jgi:hypothetical protein